MNGNANEAEENKQIGDVRWRHSPNLYFLSKTLEQPNRI